MSEKVECSETVSDSTGFRYYRCSKPVRVERNGKPYCTIHDPERVAARRAKSLAKWDAENKASAERHRKETGYDAIAARVAELEGENAKLRACADNCGALARRKLHKEPGSDWSHVHRWCSEVGSGGSILRSALDAKGDGEEPKP